MHPTAKQNCVEFKKAYGEAIAAVNPEFSIIEIGSQDVNGSLRDVWPGVSYTGVDFVAGKGVDVILDDPYALPFEDNSADIILSSSVFEHSEMFWVLFLEIMRVLKPHGLFYLNVPSNGDFHRWPVDCWRFYPDSGGALVTWARRNGINASLLESYTSHQGQLDRWNDFVGVFCKDALYVDRYQQRILATKKDVSNGVMLDVKDFVNFSTMTEDQKRLSVIRSVVDRKIAVA